MRSSDVARLYRQAEEKIKLVENLNQELVIPSVNELRYAGYHLVQHLNSSCEAEANEELRKAANHCKRAIYDAVEAGVVHQLAMIQRFQEDFRMLILSDHIPEYANLRVELSAAQKLILQPKSEGMDRGDYYEECTSHLIALRAGLESLESYREDLLKRLEQRNRATISSRVILVASVAAAIFTVVAAIYTVLGYYRGQTPEPTVAANRPEVAATSATEQPPKASTK